MTRGLHAGGAAVPPARAIFFGSGVFALAILDAVRSAPELDLVGVVSTPDRPAGRGGEPTPTPVAAVARAAGLHLLQPERLRAPETVALIEALAPVVGVLADYGRIVPPAILAAFPRGIVNVHPSLLPRHRGATPIPAAILAGDPELGVSLMELVDELDAGPVIAAASWPARGDEQAGSLEEAAAVAGSRLLREHLGSWLRGDLDATPQVEADATLTRPLRREDGRLDPTQPAAFLERQVRAYEGWPGTFIEIGSLRIAVIEARVASNLAGDLPLPDDAVPGTLLARKGGLGLATSHGVLELSRVRPAGGRSMTGAELVRGRPTLLGAALLGSPPDD